MHELSNGAVHRDGYGYGQNGTVERKQENGSANVALLEPQAQLQASLSQAGLAELIICVGGIYASLYVPRASYPPTDPNESVGSASPGPFSKNV